MADLAHGEVLFDLLGVNLAIKVETSWTSLEFLHWFSSTNPGSRHFPITVTWKIWFLLCVVCPSAVISLDTCALGSQLGGQAAVKRLTWKPLTDCILRAIFYIHNLYNHNKLSASIYFYIMQIWQSLCCLEATNILWEFLISAFWERMMAPKD